jgi:Domain of unknown function (DUF4157)
MSFALANQKNNMTAETKTSAPADHRTFAPNSADNSAAAAGLAPDSIIYVQRAIGNNNNNDNHDHLSPNSSKRLMPTTNNTSGSGSDKESESAREITNSLQPMSKVSQTGGIYEQEANRLIEQPPAHGGPLRLAIQAKLTVGQTDDPLEHEADRLAEQIMPTPDSGISVSPAQHGIRRKCTACEEEDVLQRKAVGGLTAGGREAPESIYKALSAPGQPLDASSRAFFEPRFGYDFSSVRLLTNSEAARSASDIGARAYTMGSHIVFAQGQYSSSAEGRGLLAHELAHVVQKEGAKHDSNVIRRAPWGTCPKGPRANAQNPWIYNPAQLHALGLYKARFPDHCIMTDEMLAAGIVPRCRGEENTIVNNIMQDFHHDKYVKRGSVGSPSNVTRRPESRKGALIQRSIEMVPAMQMPDIIDITASELYDITTPSQRVAKSNKFKSRYLPLLNAITGKHWSAGTRLPLLSPLSFKVPKVATICFGPTDFARWPGVIQYEAIKLDDEKSKGKKEDKKGKEKKKKASKKDEKSKGKKGGKQAGSIGLGIGIFSTGSGGGNASLGVSINSHGASYGTVSAGIVYNSNGDAVGTATAGAAKETSGTTVGTATAGAAKETSGTTVASTSAGESKRSSGVSVATASHGESKDIDDTAIAKAGKSESGDASGSQKAAGKSPGGEQGTGDASGSQKAAGKSPGGEQGTPSAGLQIPGKSEAETQRAVTEAARIDAELQKATPAQKELLEYLAQISGDRQYEVSGADWVRTFMTATANLSEEDIKFLQQQHWRPVPKVTAEELRRHIDEVLRNRTKPQAGGDQDAPSPDKKPRKDKKAEGTRSSDIKNPEKAEQKLNAASLDETPASSKAKKAETDQEAYARLHKRAKDFKWAQMRTVGMIDYGKEGKVYGKTASGALYFSTVVRGKRIGFTADVAGILTKGSPHDTIEIRSSSIIVASDGRWVPGKELVGLTFTLEP